MEKGGSLFGIPRTHMAILWHFVRFHLFSTLHYVKPVLGEILEGVDQNKRGM